MAIVGMGCLFPGADGLARYWASIRRAVDAIGDVPESHWSTDDYFDTDPKAADRTYARRGGFLEPVEFPPMEFGITPNAIEAIDTTQLLGLMVARRALEDAGYGEAAGKALDRDRVGVILGVTGTLELVIPLGARLGHPIWRRALRESGVDEGTADEVVRRISDSYVGWQENSFPGLLGNVAAGRIANRLDLRGTNCVVDAACASSLAAVNLALLELASGRSDMVVTGGLDTFNDIFMYMCFSKTPALSPTGEARPFDAGADGTILGEGLGVLVLKRLDDARRDGDRVYAVIRSMGTSSDGRGQAVYAPSAAGQARALREAYRLAGVSPATVGLVEAHGTGTRVGDATELEALSEVYRGAREGGPWCAIGSVKSQVGHTKAAAGAAGLIKAALALHHKVLPSTLKVRRPAGARAREDSPFYLNDAARPWPAAGDAPRRAAVSAFGFGGSNFHCVLEEAEPEKLAVDWDGDVQILAFSADEPKALARQLDAVMESSRWPEVRAIGARTRAAFRVEDRYRLLVVVERGGRDLAGLLVEARDRVVAMAADGASGRRDERSRPEGAEAGVFTGAGETPGSLALLFPGQGSQYVGMLRELACQFPAMQAALGAVDRELNDAESRRLSDRIYPPSAFDDPTREAQATALRDTRFAQPAIGAISLGLLGILEDFGVQPELVGGHSFGELTALRAAGRIDDATFWRLARVRGALMGDCAAAGTGRMLAAFAAADRIEATLREHRLDLVIANRNAPAQCVLSGPSAEIERAQRILAERGIVARVLPVSAAFHSRFVESARLPFRRELAAADLHPAVIPVFANSIAEPYPADAELARDLLADQLARPVRFVEQVEAMYRTGARTFLEVGPGARLTGLVRATLEGRPHAAFSVDASSGARGNAVDLACSLATLAALGYAVDLTCWDAGGAAEAVAPRRPGPTVSISGANSRPRVRELEETRHEAIAIGTVKLSPRRVGAPPAIAARLPAEGAEEYNGASALALPPRHHAGNDRMTNPVQEPVSSPQTNGHVPAGTMSIAEPAGSPSSRLTPRLEATATPKVRPDELHRALREGQDNLEALQRLAEQTAELHRLFLQGQEKVQQTFARLLEQQQELALHGRVVVESDASGAGIPPLNGRPEPTHAWAGALAATGESAVLRRGMEEPHAVSSPVWSRPDSAEVNGHVPPPAVPEHRIPEVVATPEVRAFAAASAGPTTHSEQAVAALLDVVSEKTGYPAEVLGLDMRLDDDLGIDSIKRVEILSSLQERYPGLPTPSPERLASFRTLGAIGEYLQSEGEGDRQVKVEDVAVTAKSDVDDEVARTLLATVAEKT
ncbi:MAG: beta-ketoacyl synthase N-terminal-like domain-containing protein, partial [Isosphaeraceae bacterium]